MASELTIELRREQVARLKCMGMTVREIATQVGVTGAQVQRDIEAVFLRAADNADASIAIAKAQMLQRGEMLRKAVVQQALTPKIQNADGGIIQSPRQLEAVATMLKIDEREAKLLGLDAPARSELSGPAGGPIPLEARSALEQKLDRLGERLRSKPSGTPGAGPDRPS